LVKRSISRDRDSVKSKKPGATTAGSERDLIPWHLAKRFEDRDKALARILKPVHAVGTQALKSEMAAEDLGNALRGQAGESAPILVDQEFQLSLKDRDVLIRKS
jgi:hypothetical protein